jgi:hypothetical protein
MSLIGRTWEDETPEFLDKKINRLHNNIKELEQDKFAFFIANDGKTVDKAVTSPDKRISWSTVEYKNKFYTLTCGDSIKPDRRVAWCDVHEGKSLYERMDRDISRWERMK